MSDHVSWGLYIANFTFVVGLAAGGVMMVIPAYLYHDNDMHDVVIVGELLAVASIVMALGFVTVDLGRPDRVWHMLPGLGRFNFPRSMLTWDVIVLNGYLLLNLHVCGYLLYMRFRGRKPPTRAGTCPSSALHRLGHLHPHRHRLPLLGPRRPPLLEQRAPRPALPRLGLHHRPRLHHPHAPARCGASPRLRNARGAIQRLLSIMRGHRAGEPLHARVSELFTEFYTGGAHTGLRALPLLRAPRPPRARPLDLDRHRAQRRPRRGLLPHPAHPRAPPCGAQRRPRRTFVGRLDREGHGAHRPGLHPEHAARDRRVRAQLATSGRSPRASGRSG
jgi:hypothetical protein